MGGEGLLAPRTEWVCGRFPTKLIITKVTHICPHIVRVESEIDSGVVGGLHLKP